MIKNGNISKTINAAVLVFFCITLAVCTVQKEVKSETDPLASSPDAIAFRVMPNPEHTSPLRWYKDNIPVQGSPQSLLVDGYDAIREGRSVYANVANIVDGKFYTNIYIISYNQQARASTVDIFGRLLMNWKFNTNLAENGSCDSFSALCSADSDCPADYACKSGKCELKIETRPECLTDSDCPSNQFCSSLKADVVRDTRRLADLYDLKYALNEYCSANGNYPLLGAGTYLIGQTISVWPSWQNELARELKIKIPLDPVNRLGPCGDSRFQSVTCWDEINKEFADRDSSDYLVDLPHASSAYVYSSLDNGGDYRLCAVMGSGMVTDYNCQ